MRPGCCTPSAGTRCRRRRRATVPEIANGTWLIAGFDELAANVPGCISFDRTTDPEHWEQLFAQAHERGAAVLRHRLAQRRRRAQTSRAPKSLARLETEIANLLNAVHTVQADDGGETSRRTVDHHRTGRGDRIRRAGRPGAGGAVGTRPHHRSTRNRPCAAGWSTATDHDEAVHSLANLLGTPVEEPELALRQGKLLASRLLPWARSGHLAVPRSTDYVLAPTERGAIDNLRLAETDVPPPDEGQVQVRVEAAGLNFRDVLNVLGLYPGDPG